MAFIDIEAHKSPIGVEVMLRPYKRGEKITPEVCYNVLKATNFQRNIRDMLTCVTKLSPEEQRAFKEVVLATFDNREHSAAVALLGQELAKAGNYEDELAEVSGIKNGAYLYAFPQRKIAFVISDDKTQPVVISGQRGREWFHSRDFSAEDWSAYDVLIIRSSQDINVSGIKKFPPQIVVEDCPSLRMAGCDLQNVKDIRIEKCTDLVFPFSFNFPEVLDVSKCQGVHFNNSSLIGVKKLTFRDRQQAWESKVGTISEGVEIIYAEDERQKAGEGNTEALQFARRENRGR